MMEQEGVFQLKGVVQNYSWGGFHFLPSLLGVVNSDQKPFAEYWLGAHPNYPSDINGLGPATELLQAHPQWLGKAAAENFGSLPFLLKILDVRQMLSIQVHPGKEAALRGFEEEEARGIPVKAPHRNYRDRNPKPELMVALGDFWLLHGFKKPELLRKKLQSTGELDFLLSIFDKKGYKGLFETVMQMEQSEVNGRLESLSSRILPLYEQNKLTRNNEDFWAARAIRHFCQDGKLDRGIFCIYIFNLVHLRRGQGVFQPAGLPHAYLEGQNVEVMSNSDNVLRAGLTDKHVDVPELLKHVHFAETLPNILNPAGGGHTVYTTPAAEFELHHYNLKEKEIVHWIADSAEILLLLEGSLQFNLQQQTRDLKKGEACFVCANTILNGKSLSQSSLYRVRVPG